MDKKSILFGMLLFIGMAGLLKINAISRYSWKDSTKNMYWEITNQTGDPITVSSDIKQVEIQPGKKANLPREKSFSFTVETAAGMDGEFQTDNHFVDIYISEYSNRPNLKIHSYTEWPGK